MIVPMECRHIRQVAELHRRYIKSLLGDLGFSLCVAFYMRAIRSRECFGFVDEQGPVVRGFVLAATDNSKLFAHPRLRWILARRLLLRPRLIPRILFHLNNGWPAAPEVLYEAVAESYRRQGIATRLNEAVRDAFHLRGIHHYEIRIDKTNVPNLARHQKLGARIIREYCEAGIARCLLVAEIRSFYERV